MAITAAITLDTATVTCPLGATATCTITNNNSTDANVLGLDPVVTPTGTTPQSVAVQAGYPALGPGVTVRVAASGGTLAIPFKLKPFSPFSGEGLAMPAQQVYDIGATIRTSATGADSLVAASTTTLTVNAPTSH